MFHGKTLRMQLLSEGFIELCFDRGGESVNKFDTLTVDELQQAVQELSQDGAVRGVLVSSAKDSFVVGADIFEFTSLFERSPDEIEVHISAQCRVFTALSQLPIPTAAAINGMAFGGGLEVALACDHRVLADTAVIGLPEVTLGIIPAYGGSTRLPRIAGAATALQWITGGAPNNSTAALTAGAVDVVTAPETLREMALTWLRDASEGRHDWRGRRTLLQGRVSRLDDAALAAARVATAKNARHYPAAAAFVQFLADTQSLDVFAALEEEARVFSRLCKTDTAPALVKLFVNDQFLKKRARSYVKEGRPLRQAAVLGAGIMGGGIAYTSAARGVPALMRDVRPEALQAGLAEADRLLAKQVESGRMKAEKAQTVRASIHAQLDYADFDRADVVVEAIVENLEIKKQVLAEVESLLREDATIATNTSSLSVGEMAKVLRRPQNFVGMHFFNPVPQMPLVEVIRGPQTAPVVAATAAGNAVVMGKTPIVVKDCPGFLVNRILTPYMLAFQRLLYDGADYRQVDRVIEAFGWPMGPAYLADVIGLDTLARVLHVISSGYGARMQPGISQSVNALAERQRLGQKSGVGFYRYENDARGKPKKVVDDEAAALVASLQPHGSREFRDEEIIDRLMLPMVLEGARCLDEGVAESAIEVDMGLILGLGFPRHLGGLLYWAERGGLQSLLQRCERYRDLSPLYEPYALLRDRAAGGRGFHH